MKIAELRLTAVGPFTDTMLDLSAGTQGLHIVYGSNEAGKSSALRAIRYLLYGFPTRLADDFVHSYPQLRVGGRLVNERGDELRITRRKARQKSLRDENDEAEIADDRLRGFLGNADEELFCGSFGIDHERLVRGGREIVQGEGDLGRMLFSGAGVADLRDLEQQLKNELDQMFAPRGKNQAINCQLRQLKEARQQVRDNQLRPAQWQQHYTTLQDALQRKQQVEAERNAKRRRLDRLVRFQSALPQISEYLELQAESQQLQQVILLPADFNTRRENLLRDKSIKQAQRESALKEIQQRQDSLAQIEPPQDLLDCGPRLESLQQSLHRYQDALADRPPAAASLNNFEADVRTVLRELGKDAALDQAAALLLPAPERARIQRLVVAYGECAKAVEDGKRELANLEADLRGQVQKLGDTPIPPAARSLQQAVTEALKLGEIQQQLAELRHRRDCQLDDADRDLQRLPGWSGPLDQLTTLQVPVPETVERFVEQFRKADEAVEVLAEQLRQTRQERETAQQSLDQLRADQDVPTEDQLTERRAQRDQAWRLLRKAATEHNVDAAERDTFLASIGASGAQLEDAFESLVSAADTLSDRLRHEADRVARHGQLQAKLARTGQRLDELRQQQPACQEGCRQVSTQWQRLWQDLGVEPLPPREMRSWLQAHAALVERARTIRQLQQQEQQRSKTLAQGKRQLAGALKTVGQAEASSAQPLDELREAGQAAVESLRERVVERREIEREVERLSKAQQQSQRRLAQAERRHDEWRAQWAAAVAKLPAGTVDQPAEANQVLELLHQLSLKLNNVDQQRGRLAEIDAFSGQFEGQVRELARLLAPDLADQQPVPQVATEILARYRRAVDQDKERTRIRGELEQRQASLETASAAVSELASQLEQLCQEAGCDAPDQLLSAWEQSQHRRQVHERLQRLRTELRKLSAATPLEQFVAEAQAQDADTLASEINRLEQDVAETNCLLGDEVGPTIGGEQEALRRMDSSGKAAAAAEDARDIVAGLRDKANEYAVLCAAHVALQHGIERYRQRHQDPVLGTASNVFGQLTAGSFTKLKVDFDSGGQPTLTGVRAGTGAIVPVSGMSDGTADQLYLALRYAWLVHYLERHESLPFIVDDILIRFDDDRARETLKVLAELSRRTQVLFFTHHRHLLEVAAQVLPADTLFVHQLARGERGP